MLDFFTFSICCCQLSPWKKFSVGSVDPQIYFRGQAKVYWRQGHSAKIISPFSKHGIVLMFLELYSWIQNTKLSRLGIQNITFV